MYQGIYWKSEKISAELLPFIYESKGSLCRKTLLMPFLLVKEYRILPNVCTSEELQIHFFSMQMFKKP